MAPDGLREEAPGVRQLARESPGLRRGGRCGLEGGEWALVMDRPAGSCFIAAESPDDCGQRACGRSPDKPGGVTTMRRLECVLVNWLP